MATIDLEPHCLACDDLEVRDDTRRLVNGFGKPMGTIGSITCSHARTCKHMGEQPTVSQVLGELYPMGDPEPSGATA